MSESRGCSGTLARAGAGFFALAYAVTLPVSLLAFAWGNVLFSADDMTDIIAGELIDSGVLQELAVEAMLQRGGEPNEQGVLDFLARQDLDQILATVVPPDWARRQIQTNLEGLYGWLDDDRLLPRITLDLQPIKSQMQGGGAARLVETVVSSWPDCGPEQIEALTRQGLGGGGLPEHLCQPPEPLRSNMIGELVALLERQARGLPDTAQLGEGSPSSASQQDMLRLKRSGRILRGLAQVGWLLPASALGLVVALGVRSWPQLLRWWGTAILAGGLATFLAMFISGGVVESALDSAAIAELPMISVRPVLRSLVDRLLDETMGRLFVLAFVTTAIGLAMLVPGLLIARRRAETYSVPR